MSDTAPSTTRRRWINLGEIVAVLALLISAASFWDARLERQREAAMAARPAQLPPLVLTGSVEDDGELLRIAAAGDVVLQTQTIRFPKAIGADVIETNGNPRIEADWFAAELRSALDGSVAKVGRLPIAIETRYIVEGREATDRAVYDLAYRLRERTLRPDAVEIEGMTLVAHAKSTDATISKIDGRWARLRPGA